MYLRENSGEKREKCSKQWLKVAKKSLFCNSRGWGYLYFFYCDVLLSGVHLVINFDVINSVLLVIFSGSSFD